MSEADFGGADIKRELSANNGLLLRPSCQRDLVPTQPYFLHLETLDKLGGAAHAPSIRIQTSRPLHYDCATISYYETILCLNSRETVYQPNRCKTDTSNT